MRCSSTCAIVCFLHGRQYWPICVILEFENGDSLYSGRRRLDVPDIGKPQPRPTGCKAGGRKPHLARASAPADAVQPAIEIRARSTPFLEATRPWSRPGMIG